MSNQSMEYLSRSTQVVEDLSLFDIESSFSVARGGDPVNQEVSISVSNITNGQATVNYQTLPNSKPSSLGYQVLIFQGGDIPWTQGTTPAQRFIFPNNSPTGSFVARAQGIGTAEYIAVLQTNGRYYDSFAYSSTIPKIGGKSVSDQTEINSVEVGDNTVSVNFSTLSGNKPKTYRNWVGIWNAATPSFNGSGVTAFSWIPSDNPNGSVQLNATLNRGTVYAIAYGTGPNWGTVSQYVTINT